MRIDREYNELQIKRLKRLYDRGNKYFYVDLHIHTNYSADGTQTFEQAYAEAIKQGMDIVALTDHDSIAVYGNIGEEYGRAKTGPIIIPGIEFTVSVPNYNGRCHILKYFIDENDEGFSKNLNKIQDAYNTRIDLWFERIKENRCLQHYAREYNIDFCKEDYLKFLETLPLNIPEYSTLMNYLFFLMDKHHISVWDVYNRVNADNEEDTCLERREKKRKLLEKFYNKYQNSDIERNYRKLRPILAPVGVDDSLYKEYPSKGNLSVIEYGQVCINELANCGFNIWAHPDMQDSNSVDRISKYVCGYELNYRSTDDDNKYVESLARRRRIAITKGSDTHNLHDGLYENKDFYRLSREDFKKFILLAERAMEQKYGI